MPHRLSGGLMVAHLGQELRGSGNASGWAAAAENRFIFSGLVVLSFTASTCSAGV